MEKKEQISLIFSLLAFCVATLSFWLNRRNAILARQPVVVFEYDQGGWRVRNIGKGPAMNLVVHVRGRETKWLHPVSVPSLREGSDFDLSWIGSLNVWMLGATYADYEGHRYTTVGQHDRVKQMSGHVLGEFEEAGKDYLPGAHVTRPWNAKPLTDESLT